MKQTILTFISSMLISASVSAQSINNSVSFSAGDSHFLVGASIELQPGAAGQNVTWNFDTLSYFEDTIITNYVAASATPYASSFTNANLASVDEYGFYSYYNVSANEVLFLGSQDSTTSFNFSNSQKLLTFPTSYNSSYTDNFNGTLLVNDFMPINGSVTGSLNSICDGVGTLKLPSGTYLNALRRKLTNVQTTSFTFLGQTMSVTDSIISYEWFHPNVKGPLLSITTSIAPDSLGGSSHYYQLNNQIQSSVNELKSLNSQLGVYPNPVSNGELELTLNLKKSENIILNIINATGSVVFSEVNANVGSGKYSQKVNTSQLPKGIYFASIQTETQKYTQKFVIE